MVPPTPGHSYGHQSVIVFGTDRTFVLAGDATINETQPRRRTLVSIDPLRTFVRAVPSVYSPIHDPRALARLAAGQLTRLEDTP